MPYFHLSFCHTWKIIQHTVFLFNFTLCTRKKKKTHIFHQRSQKIHLDLNLSLFRLFQLNTILVTNRWNRSHLSWIFSKFHSWHLRSLTNVSLSFPNVKPCIFWSTETTVIPKSTLGKGKITQVFQDLWQGL